MSLECWFYDHEVSSVDASGNPITEVSTFFHLSRPSAADSNAQPFVFDGPATARHIHDHESLYAKYLAEKHARAQGVVTGVLLPSEESVPQESALAAEPIALHEVSEG